MVGAAVDGKGAVELRAGRGIRLRRRGVIDVGADIRPAKPVDRLLGIAHAHERPPVATGKEPLEEPPLLAVGVLGLVDDREAEPAAEGGEQLRPGLVADELPRHAEQVVVARCGRHRGMDPVHARPQQRAEAFQTSPVGGGETVVVRVDPRLDQRVAEHRLHELADLRLVPAVVRGRVAHDEVVDHLFDDPVLLVGVGDPASVDSRGPQHAAADSVDRRDRGRVELHQRPLEPPDPVRDLGVGAVAKPRRNLVAGGVCAPQRAGGLDEPPADAIAELRGGVLGERRDQNLPDPQILAEGEFPRDDGGHGVGLPRAGARLDDQAVGERVVGEVKVHRVCTRSCE